MWSEGRPYVDRIEGSEFHNMKELRTRPTGRGQVIRVLFAFDMESRAITLIGGDKAGNWKKWYAQNVPVADALFAEHQSKVLARRRAADPTASRRKK